MSREIFLSPFSSKSSRRNLQGIAELGILEIILIYFIFIFLTQQQTMMFEVADLAVASPATVSRCGMVYLEPSILGLQPFVNCWLNDIPEQLNDHKETLLKLFKHFLKVRGHNLLSSKLWGRFGSLQGDCLGCLMVSTMSYMSLNDLKLNLMSYSVLKIKSL